MAALILLLQLLLLTVAFADLRSLRPLVIRVPRQRSDAPRKSRYVTGVANEVTHASTVQLDV